VQRLRRPGDAMQAAVNRGTDERVLPVCVGVGVVVGRVRGCVCVCCVCVDAVVGVGVCESERVPVSPSDSLSG
jgi:hypothetical protein